MMRIKLVFFHSVYIYPFFIREKEKRIMARPDLMDGRSFHHKTIEIKGVDVIMYYLQTRQTDCYNKRKARYILIPWVLRKPR